MRRLPETWPQRFVLINVCNMGQSAYIDRSGHAYTIIDGVKKIDAHTISLADFMFHFAKQMPITKCDN